ncbi:MAG: GAF domain-containing sensor histidine kinase [Thermoflexibacter sp.]|nr:GAF domain-containing sensor histidine kinase [Thermoflexibacter sp.]
MNFSYSELDIQTKTEERLKKYAKQQEILLKVSVMFNSVDHFEKQIHHTLQIIGNYMGVSHVYIFKDDEDTQTSQLIFEWYYLEAINHRKSLSTISYQQTPSWRETLSQKGCIVASDVQTLPIDVIDLLASKPIKSILIVPLYFKDKISGFMGFDDYEHHRVWDNTDLEFITTVSNLISHSFERYEAEEKLKITLENQHKINQELVRQNNELQQFTYIVSHNLRAPVANLLGLVSLYRTYDPTHEVNKIALDNIRIVSQQLDYIVRDLNEIVEIKQQVIEETKENVSLEEELREILHNLERQIYLAQAQINIDFSKVSYIFTIRKYLNSILLHLLSNALKYKHPDRLPIIHVFTELSDNQIRLMVQDNGLGIDLKKNGAKIFGFHKRFHSHVEGKGMGLYLVKLQTEALGGHIEVDSKLDEGSVFKVYLPR